MKIKDLPNGLRELAESRIDENFRLYPYFLKSDGLVSAFEWDRTKEGFNFWEEIDDGNFKPYYDMVKEDNKDLDFMLNDILNKALITDRIKQVNSNEIADYVSNYLKDKK